MTTAEKKEREEVLERLKAAAKDLGANPDFVEYNCNPVESPPKEEIIRHSSTSDDGTRPHEEPTFFNPTPEKQEDWEIERLAMNIVYQIGDLLGDKLKTTDFIGARQATNDQAIDFTKKLISALLSKEREKNLEALKLWRPYFYRDKITDEDIAELPAIFGLTNSHQKE